MPTVVIRRGKNTRVIAADAGSVEVKSLPPHANYGANHAELKWRVDGWKYVVFFDPSEVVVHRGDVWELCNKSANIKKLWGME